MKNTNKEKQNHKKLVKQKKKKFTAIISVSRQSPGDSKSIKYALQFLLLSMTSWSMGYPFDSWGQLSLLRALQTSCLPPAYLLMEQPFQTPSTSIMLTNLRHWDLTAWIFEEYLYDTFRTVSFECRLGFQGMSKIL